MRNIEVFKRHLREKRAVKIIAGIDNYDLESVRNVSKAAQLGLASAVDVAANEEVIKAARQNTKLPIFVSSVEPFKLAKAAQWGADAIEIGNFDALYKKGLEFGADDVYEIALETLTLTPNGIFTCVTVPGNIPVEEQIELAKKLELLGIDMIQTEGSKAGAVQKAKSAQEFLNLAKVTISNTMEIARHVGIPIMTASGVNADTAPLAFAAGASAVGVGSAVNKQETQIAMINAVRKVVGAIAYRDAFRRDVYETNQHLLMR